MSGLEAKAPSEEAREPEALCAYCGKSYPLSKMGKVLEQQCCVDCAKVIEKTLEVIARLKGEQARKLLREEELQSLDEDVYDD